MAETSQISFSYKEVVEALIKKHGLNEGLWMLAVNFGLQATNIGPTDADLKPAAIVGLLGIALQRADKETNLTVNAAYVNPPARRTDAEHKNPKRRI
jgi:hypothetical protein